MKIKSKSKNKKTPKFWGGGGGNVAAAGAMALKLANSFGSSGTNGWDNSQTGNSFGKQYGENLKSSLPGAATSLSTITSSEQSSAAKTGQVINSIGDTAVSNIPGFGQYYGMIRGFSKGIQSAIPGDTKIDPKTGISYTKKDSTFGQGMNTILEPAHSQAATTWGKAAAANNSKDKAKYAFEGIGDMFGLTTIPKMIANAMGKDDDTMNYNRIKNSETRTNADTSTFAYGGGLDKYTLPSHAQQNSDVPNTHLDGQPIQIDKNETVFRKDGGNYVFSDTLKNTTGNTFAKDSKLTEAKFKRPYYDSIAESTKNDALEKLTVQNDMMKQMQEMKEFSKKFKFGGSIPKAEWGKRGSGIPIDKPNMDIQWNNNGMPNYGDYTVQNNMKEMTTLPSYTDMKNKYGNDKPEFYTPPPKDKKGFNWSMDGDQMQLAGMLPSVAYNAGMAMQPADKEKALYNPYQDKVKDLYTSRYFNEQPIINENQLDFNKGRADIENSATSDPVRRANLIEMTSNLQKANTNARFEGQKINNEYKGQLGQVLDNLGQQRVAEDRRVSEINAQNKGRKQLFGAEAATQSGQALTEAGKAKNQKVSNQVQLSALNNIYADFGTKYKNIDEFYRNASVDEILAYKKYITKK